MPKYRRGSGSVYLKRGWCYLKYYVSGKPAYEAARTKNKAEARRILQARLGQLPEGRYLGPAVERVIFEELARDLVTDYEVNKRKSLPMLAGKIHNHLTPFFASRRTHDISTADVQEFIQQRLGEGASNAEINWELAALKRMFTLGRRAEKISPRPPIFQSWKKTTYDKASLNAGNLTRC